MQITENNKLKKRIIIKYFFKENFSYMFFMIFLNFLPLLIFYLTDIELPLVIYISTLAVLFLIIFFIVKFIFYYRKNMEYFNFLEQLEINSENFLFENEAFDNSIFSLQEIISVNKIKKIISEKEEAVYENRKRIIEQNDYFSLWIHQIKTPITSINILLQNMKYCNEDVFQIQKALLSIDNYTQMALHYLKLQSSDKDLTFSEFNLNDVLQNIFRKYRSVFIYKNIELNCKNCNIKIISDSVLFELMIEQLVSNSLKYCGIDDKKGVLSIYIDKENPETIVIEDNGIGISASDLPKIFDKGYSGLNGRLAEKATGLGLYLAKEISKRLNCKIIIDSVENEWTRAYVQIESH